MVYKTSSTLAQIKAVVPNCASGHHILHGHALAVEKQKQASFT